jgi:hypothetical protein
MQIKRKSEHVAQVMRDLRQAALKETNAEWRSKLWRWYYSLLHGETEIQLMVAHSETRCLLEIYLAHGMLPENWKDEIAKLEAKLKAEVNQQASLVDDIDDIDAADIPPIQKRLFD